MRPVAIQVHACGRLAQAGVATLDRLAALDVLDRDDLRARSLTPSRAL